MTSIFLSYARGDDEPFVKRLCADLTTAGFTVWFDRESLLSRGLTFHQEIRDAIRGEVNRIVYVGGPKAAVSEYVREEWKLGLEFDHVVVTPILRLGTYDDIPGELSLLHCEDFRQSADYDKAFAKLFSSLNEPNPKLGALVAVPSLPAHFLARPELMRRVRDALLVDLQTPHVITSSETHVGMQGMGGIGKSVLAAALARNRQVRQAYPNGIVWISCGQKLTREDILSRMRDLVAALGGDANFTSFTQGQGILRELLQAKAVLLILDDVWDAAVAKEFDVLGPRCRMLITTRDAGILHTLHGERVPVSLFTEAEALQLLADAVGVESSALCPEARAVAEECGQLPLALALAGGMAKKRNGDFQSVLERFRRADLKKIADRASINPQHESLWRAMQASVEMLSADEQRRFAELAVYPEDATVPEPAVATLWSHTGQLDDLDSEDLLINLSERSLIQLDATTSFDGTITRRISLHDLLHDYAVRTAGDLKLLHKSLVDAYQVKCCDEAGRRSPDLVLPPTEGLPTTWHHGPNDGYFFQHLREHLTAAGHTAEAHQLPKDFDWLGAKTRAGLALDLTRDVLEVHRDLPAAERQAFLPWYYFVRQNAPFLAEHPECFFQQAYNEPVDSPVSQMAQQSWSPLSRGSQHLGSTTLLRPAFLEWTNRPTHWEPPACLMTLPGHTETISSVALSADGRTIVSGSDDKTLKVWDADSGACLQTLPGHTETISSVALSADGRTIVSGSDDKTLKVWDAESGACRQTLKGHKWMVNSVALSGDGSTVVSGSWDHTVKVWDAQTGVCCSTLKGHTGRVNSVALSADGRTIVSGSHDNTLRVWDTASGDCRQTLLGHTGYVESVAFSADGRTIVSGSEDKTLKVWDAESGACRHTLQGHTYSVNSVAFSSDGRAIVSGASDRMLKVWDAESGACRQTLQGHSSFVNSVAFSADGRTIVSGSSDTMLKVWEAESGACRHTLQGYTYSVNSVAFSSDGRAIISGSSDFTIKVWDTVSRACRLTLQGHTGSVRSVALSSDSLTIVSGSIDCTIKVWDAESGTCRQTLQGHTKAVTSVALSADGRTIVSASLDETLKVWDVVSGACRQTLQEHTRSLSLFGWSGNWVSSVAISADGRTIVSGLDDKSLKVWDAESGTCRQTLQGHTKAVTSVALSADGRTIVSGSNDNTLKVWDVVSGACRHTLQGHTDRVTSVALSADGRTIVSGSWDNTVKVWDAASGACRATYGQYSTEAQAAWRSVGRIDESCRLSTKGGPMQLPPGLLPKDQGTNAATTARQSLIAPGDFAEAYGPLAGDTILAFTANGEAHWFRIRSRDGDRAITECHS